ncbi:MAG: PLDc N-terminal domain-containing protein [Deltaproteobacteria bacterium]|nr:PLDc N-terminal domain-containing protein [Deltaproteobacteria bacterium]
MMPWFLSHVLLLLGFTLAMPVIAQMLRQRRPPAASLAWLLAIVLMPFLGIPLYLVLGGRKMHRLADKKTALKMPDHALAFPLRPAPSII